ncbi:MAG: hypothetical protein U1D55_03210 [Phycisphaerae bacterium]
MRHLPISGGIAFLLPLLTGCPNTVTVEVVNETDLPVEPNIRYSAAANDLNAILTGLFGGTELSSGTVLAHTTRQFSFACDEIGVVFSNSARQTLIGVTVAEASDSGILQRGNEYDCGDTVEFHFLGAGSGFAVETRVNGSIVN